MHKSTLIGLGLGVLFWTVLFTTFGPDEYRPDFRDPDPAVRADAIRRRDWDETVPVYLLQDENVDVRLLAAERVRTASALIPLLKDTDAGVRRAAAGSLGQCGESAWPLLREAMNDGDAKVRAGAVSALLAAWPHKGFPKESWPYRKSDEIVPVLARLANGDPDEKVRNLAQEVLNLIKRVQREGR